MNVISQTTTIQVTDISKTLGRQPSNFHFWLQFVLLYITLDVEVNHFDNVEKNCHASQIKCFIDSVYFQLLPMPSIKL